MHSCKQNIFMGYAKFSIVAFLIALCFMGFVPMYANGQSESNGRYEAVAAQNNMESLAQQTTPVPYVRYFQERLTVTKWVNRWDKATPVPCYVYLVSYGKVLGYYVTEGKPASTRSYLMPQQRVLDRSSSSPVVVDAPDIDGTYGDNNAGIRFFTAGGAAVEWGGEGACYLYSDAPIDFGFDVPRLDQVASLHKVK